MTLNQEGKLIVVNMSLPVILLPIMLRLAVQLSVLMQELYMFTECMDLCVYISVGQWLGNECPHFYTKRIDELVFRSEGTWF